MIVEVILQHTPGELRVLGPPRLVPAEAEQGAERDLRCLPVLPSLAELLEPELEPPLHLGDLGGVQARARAIQVKNLYSIFKLKTVCYFSIKKL